MNLKEIKSRFSVFLNQFSKDDIKMLMQFLEMIIDEYNSNPFKLFEFLSVNQKYDENNSDNSECNSLNDFDEIERSNSCILESNSSNKLTNTNQNEDDLPDEEDETEPYLMIASPGNNNTINNNINKEANSLSSSSTNNSITKNSNGKRVSCESQSATNLSGIGNLNSHGNYILNKIGMIKSLSEQQNKIRILDNEQESASLDFSKTLQSSLADANGQIKLENIPPFLLNFDFNTVNSLNYFNNNMNEKINNPLETPLNQSSQPKYNKKKIDNVLAKLRVNAETMSSNNLEINTSSIAQNQTSKSHSNEHLNNGSEHAIDLTNPSGISLTKQLIMTDYQPKSHYTANHQHNFKICEVCEAENGTGNHYGAFTCNSCRDFFKRAISIKFQLQCLFDENCSIIKENRLKCRRCRLIKCFKVGMKSTDPTDNNKWPTMYGLAASQTKSLVKSSSSSSTKQNEEDNSNKDASEHTNGTSSITNLNTNNSVVANVKGCSICEDVGSGYFYGVFACTNCAKFYSRHRISQSQYNLVCPFENSCELNQSVKKKCSKCRFEKYKRIIEQVTLENSYIDKRFRANRNINRNTNHLTSASSSATTTTAAVPIATNPSSNQSN